LAHVPVLSFRQQLEDVVLWIEQEFKSNCTVVVFKHLVVVVSQRFLVLDSNQEVVGYSGMRDVVKQAGQEACHDLQVRNVSHQFSYFDKVMEVAGGVYDSQCVMIHGCFIAFIFDRVKQVFEIAVRYREFFQEAILLE